MIDLSPYFAMIPTGQRDFDLAFNAYLTLLKKEQDGLSIEAGAREKARETLSTAEKSATLTEEEQQLYETLMKETKELKPPSEKGPDATGSKPI